MRRHAVGLERRACERGNASAQAPGMGTSRLAHRLTTILAVMLLGEALETTWLHCGAGLTDDRTIRSPLWPDRRRPAAHTGGGVPGAP